jgi:hypothetical protein
MTTGAWQRTPGHATRSPLATVAVSRGRGSMCNPVRRAAASPMKLWVDPVSTSATRYSAQELLELDRVADSHSGDRVQGKNRGLRAWLVGVPGLVDNLETTDVKDPPTNAVVSPRILLVAVEAQA